MASSQKPEERLQHLVAALDDAGDDASRTPADRSKLKQVATELRTTARQMAIAALADPVSEEPGPRDPTLPFFAYGIFSPGEIAFFQIKRYVREVSKASVPGELRIRDGVPILDSTQKNTVVSGYRIEFRDDADAEHAYRAIRDMEPRSQYLWDTVGEMNILFGRSPNKGAREFEPTPNRQEWSSWTDLAFTDALDMVDDLLAQPREWDNSRPFYHLQGAYMVLWSSIERYASLRYGLGRSDTILQRVKRIANEPAFVDSLYATDDGATQKTLRRLFPSGARPSEGVKFNRSDPVGAIDYFYQVRCNVTHRGKAERLDWGLLEVATREVLRIFRDVLRAAENDAK